MEIEPILVLLNYQEIVYIMFCFDGLVEESIMHDCVFDHLDGEVKCGWHACSNVVLHCLCMHNVKIFN